MKTERNSKAKKTDFCGLACLWLPLPKKSMGWTSKHQGTKGHLGLISLYIIIYCPLNGTVYSPSIWHIHEVGLLTLSLWLRIPYWVGTQSLLVSATFVNSCRSRWRRGRSTRDLRASTRPQLPTRGEPQSAPQPNSQSPDTHPPNLASTSPSGE